MKNTLKTTVDYVLIGVIGFIPILLSGRHMAIIRRRI